MGLAAYLLGLCFYRDSTGNEVDLVLERGRNLALMEIKSGQTVTRQFFQGLDKFTRISGDRVRGGVVVETAFRAPSGKRIPAPAPGAVTGEMAALGQGP